MTKTGSYTPHFYEIIRDGCRSSADTLVPMLVEMFGEPETVLDVGGGEGWWSRAYEEFGAKTTLLESSDAETMSVGDRLTWDLDDPRLADRVIDHYDVAVCLEVAEHLHNPEQLIDFLCKASDTIVFSAAIPGQSGAGHINCKWQSEWAAMFIERGYEVSQALAFHIWENRLIEPWYRQDLLICTTDKRHVTQPKILDIVHPEIWAWLLP